jgi:tripartite-type tricarboxylate transporter receptor subunit TctC
MRFAAALAVVVAWLPALAPAQTYPARPVRVVNGFGPGSATDIAGRIIAQRLSQNLGQQFVVESRTGAGSSIAAELVARAPKDGYTLFMGTVANAINASTSSNLNFDFARDFAPIALVASLPNILVVHPSVGASNVKELVALAKAKPGQLFFASPGVGTSGHLTAELFNTVTGVKLEHVPYNGSPAAVADLLAGQTTAMFSPLSTVLPHMQAGKLRALASAFTKRSPAAPELPTMEEAGYPGFNSSVWTGLLAPVGTPPEVIARVAQAVNEGLKSPEVVAALQQNGMDARGGTSEEFARLIAAEIQRWGEVAKATGLKQ